MNQIIAVIILFGIVTVVFAPLIAESGTRIFSNSISISDSMELSKLQTGQMMLATNIEQYNGVIRVYLSNIGLEDIQIHAVLVDGVNTPYNLKNQDEKNISIFVAGELGMLEITGVGNRVQIVTTSGKLFEFNLELM